MEKDLARWKGRCLSYRGRVQLVNWVFAGLFSYWINGTILPDSVISKVSQIAYRFIWYGKYPSLWSRMVLPRKYGGLGVRNFEASAKASHVKMLRYFGLIMNPYLPYGSMRDISMIRISRPYCILSLETLLCGRLTQT